MVNNSSVLYGHSLYVTWYKTICEDTLHKYSVSYLKNTTRLWSVTNVLIAFKKILWNLVVFIVGKCCVFLITLISVERGGRKDGRSRSRGKRWVGVTRDTSHQSHASAWTGATAHMWKWSAVLDAHSHTLGWTWATGWKSGGVEHL